MELLHICLLVNSLLITLAVIILAIIWIFKPKNSKLSKENLSAGLTKLPKMRVDNRYELNSQIRSIRLNNTLDEDCSEIGYVISNSQEPLLQNLNQMHHDYEEVDYSATRQKNSEIDQRCAAILELVVSTLTTIYERASTNNDISESFLKELATNFQKNQKEQTHGFFEKQKVEFEWDSGDDDDGYATFVSDKSKNQTNIKILNNNQRISLRFNEKQKVEFEFDSGDEDGYATFVSDKANLQTNVKIIDNNSDSTDDVFELFLKALTEKIRSTNPRLHRTMQRDYISGRNQYQEVNQTKKLDFVYDSDADGNDYATFVSNKEIGQRNKMIVNNNQETSFGITDHLQFLTPSTSKIYNKDAPYLEAKRFYAKPYCPESLKKITQGTNKSLGTARLPKTSNTSNWSHKEVIIEKTRVSFTQHSKPPENSIKFVIEEE